MPRIELSRLGHGKAVLRRHHHRLQACCTLPVRGATLVTSFLFSAEGNAMTTTSLKLPDDLKQRTASAARQLGISPHAFMLHAIEKAALAAEQRNQFVADALAAREALLETGQGYDVGEVHAYLKGRVAGKVIPRPVPRSWQD